MDFQTLQSAAQAEVSAILAALPEPLREVAGRLPIIYEMRPDPPQQDHTRPVEADTLGLFIGCPLAETESAPGELAAHIILFLENLWDCADGEAEIFRSEVRTTFLHELGHYLGLDEDDLLKRGLE
jgi:predicted Zn-dependent protease with MMP-like domain